MALLPKALKLCVAGGIVLVCACPPSCGGQQEEFPSTTNIGFSGSEAQGYTAYGGASWSGNCNFQVEEGFQIQFGNYSDSVEIGSSDSVSTPPYPFGPGGYGASGSWGGGSGEDQSGDPPYPYCIVDGSSGSGTLIVPMETPILSISPPTAPVPQGTNVYIPVSVSVPNPFLIPEPPSGNISLYYGATNLVTAKLTGTDSTGQNGEGYISASTSGIPQGKYSVEVVYAGDGNYYSVTSPAFTITIGPPLTSTTTALVVTPNPALVGDQITLKATVTPKTTEDLPTGTLTFVEGSLVLGTATLNASSPDVATLTLSSKGIPAGAYSVVANYSGDSKNIASSSSAVTVTFKTVSATTTAVTIQPESTVVQGQAVTLGVTVSPQTGNTAPAGTVALMINGQVASTLTLKNGSTSLQMSTSSVAAGTYSVSAKYNGSATDTSSTSTVQKFTLLAATATSASASPNPVSEGAITVLTAAVKETVGSAIPTGTVTFSSGGTTLGSGMLNASGKATFPMGTDGLPAGTMVITAAYSGDTANGASRGTVTLTVQ